MALAGRAPTLLVNCAALFREDTILSVTGAMLEEHMAVNLAAPVLLTRALADLTSEAAAVVHILDQRVINPVPDQLSYTLSKQALHAAVRTLARSLAPRIRVNAVAPGLTLPTPDYSAAQWARLTALMPLERLAAPEEIAEAVLFLAQARAVTGQTIFVDGGAHLESFARDFVYLEA
jgi:NAD(P)-dependent dehydrogenase (short-subunit alcohol dehydrogenase family)